MGSVEILSASFLGIFTYRTGVLGMESIRIRGLLLTMGEESGDRLGQRLFTRGES
jgi:hypothetical protein